MTAQPASGPGRSPATFVAAVLALAILASGPGADRVAAQAAPVSPRVSYTLNDGWRYVDGSREDAESPGHDDSGWWRVDLPHTWNAGAATAESPDYRRGVGWYRRPFDLDPSLRGKRLFLRFEGANQVADVWVNGRPAGRHVGGYTAFTFDITELVSWDRPNVIAVRVDNAHDPDIPPLDADFTFYGGIYRDVWLVATEPVHVTLLDHGSPGIFIDTPGMSASRSAIRVQGTLVNATDEERRVEVVNRVLDPEGQQVDALRSRVDIPAFGQMPFLQRSDRVREPRLWSPEDPNVYTVITEIWDGGRLADRVRNPLGFRWFRIDSDEGFFLNGRPLPLFGTNRHQDREGWGNALPDALHRRDIELVKATGFNFLRLAHYPQDPAVLEATDRLGLVVWEEIPVVNTITMSQAFGDHAERMLVEMIRQHYNHPSILFWGYMNEIMLREPNPRPEGYREAVVALAKRLDAFVHAEDPGRATVTAISYDEIDNGTGFQDIPDVLGFNLYFGWYYRSLEELGPFLDSLHARHPDRPLMISEYGAGSDERIHALEPVAFDFSTEHQQRFHESHLRQLMERPYLVGNAVWIQFDFGSAGRHDSKPNINQKGLLYYDREPKDLWHYYRARFLDSPVLHIATRDWPRRAGSRPGDARQPIVVYSNLSRVELIVNGVSAGTLPVSEGSARWSVTLAHGANRLEARGVGESVAVRDETVVLYHDRSPLFAATPPREETDAPTGADAAAGAAPAAQAVAGAVAVTGARAGVAAGASPWAEATAGAEATAIAVNAGSHYHYVDAAGTVWEPDGAYEPGSWGHLGGEPRLDHRRIAGTTEDALFQATREGATAYRFDVVDGEYDVRILLAETRHGEPGERVVTVRVNGVAAVASMDLAGVAGPYVAVERKVRVTADGGSGVVVRLEADAGATTISGIEVRKR